MKLHYYPETDSLYIELKDSPGVQTREVALGLNVDLDEKGEVGFSAEPADDAAQPARSIKTSRSSFARSRPRAPRHGSASWRGDVFYCGGPLV